MAKIPWFSVINDTGSLVESLISSAPGKNLIGVSEWVSLQDIWTIMAQTLKKDIEFVDDISADFGQGDPEIKRDREEMMGFLIEFGFDGGRNDRTFLRPDDLDISVKLQSISDWIGKQDWSFL
ncbi:hypothetical protein N7540_002351 [Penicillium herquei]|nr:hypothetical protein N7540_002351 [Penicillium herquei]